MTEEELSPVMAKRSGSHSYKYPLSATVKLHVSQNLFLTRTCSTIFLWRLMEKVIINNSVLNSGLRWQPSWCDWNVYMNIEMCKLNMNMACCCNLQWNFRGLTIHSAYDHCILWHPDGMVWHPGVTWEEHQGDMWNSLLVDQWLTSDYPCKLPGWHWV